MRSQLALHCRRQSVEPCRIVPVKESWLTIARFSGSAIAAVLASIVHKIFDIIAYFHLGCVDNLSVCVDRASYMSRTRIYTMSRFLNAVFSIVQKFDCKWLPP